MAPRHAEPTMFVIFGGTGDLARRKLLPALYRLARNGVLDERSAVLSVARSATLDDQDYQAAAGEALETSGVPADEAACWCKRSLQYHSIGAGSAHDYRELAARIQVLEAERELARNRVFYLALPPAAFCDVLTKLGEAGLNESVGWTRIVIEKPSGHDLASARSLNETAHRYFDESQLYRIDHYLGKETVQNLLFLRFSNTAVESLWDRDRINNIQITAAETLGIEGRADYYDATGALLDMMQSHLTQLVTLLGMGVPSRFDARSVRNEKLKLLQAVLPIRSEDVVFGQYEPGRILDESVIGYRDEPGVAPKTDTETYVAMKLQIDSWRWQGIPFYLRTGKRLKQRITQVVVTFKSPPVCLFEALGADCPNPNRLVLTLHPNEGVTLHLDVKVPNEPLRLRTIPLHFQYKEAFDEVPYAYDTLLMDLLTGDQTLFVSADETEASWELYAPLLRRRPVIRHYPAGSWGPVEADQLLARDGQTWWEPILRGA